MSYRRPESRVHRGFVYLDDETVINSLSAVEAGKIDEVVSKIASAREGGFGGGLTGGPLKVDGGKKATSALEEEIVRTRTRFSVFELWYNNLRGAKALGTFDGWGPDALDGIEAGDTIEFRADVRPAPIQSLLRAFLWFADRAREQGSLFFQKGEELKATKNAERVIKTILGGDAAQDEVVALAEPIGESGPAVAMPLARRWLIGKLGQMGGVYTVVAQVDRVLGPDDELLTMRLIPDAASTPLEISTMKEALGGFSEAADGFGVHVTESEASIVGPAVWLTPIAIYR